MKTSKTAAARASSARAGASETAEPAASSVGRPKAFDVDAALEKAMRVFWKKGYEGTSLNDLTEAMDINKPSLYSTFGNKEALFRKAVDRYQAQRSFGADALADPVARTAIERLLRGTADVQTDPDAPHGCLVVLGAVVGGVDMEPLRQELILRRAGDEAGIRQRLERAQAEGELSASVEVAALARYFMTVISGMAVQAASGATREQLHALVTVAMQAWPE